MMISVLNFGIAAAPLRRAARAMLPIAAATLLVCSCQAPQEPIRYTTICATLNEAVAVGDTVCYPRQFYRYPQLHRMANTAAQDALNRLLKLADFDDLQADAQYRNVQRLDSLPSFEHEYMYSCDRIQISCLNDELISYSGLTEYSGGAHPSFALRKARTLALNTLQPIPLNDLFVGDYRPFFKACLASSEQLAGFVSNNTVELNEWDASCNDILDALLVHVDTMSTSANMLVGDAALSIVQVDFRDFGCPEVMRGVVEVRIPYPALAPYINPAGPLRHFLGQ